ncbi:hypothetical protein [Streptomyces galbus]|uniref:hypothetical protein n=1 Tax=Streptomyces galbus TaxID=33898 RepID=UPI0019CBC938|nr:hypothetical protein GCM10010335_18730 [Streptomyces galbus]
MPKQGGSWRQAQPLNGAGDDTDKIHKRTADGAATAYTYDTRGRLTKAVESKDGSTTAGWAYCYDKARNRTGSSTGTSLPACTSAQHTYTYNDAGELTGYDSATGFTYDGAGNETAAASPTGTRTAESWTPFTQLAASTQSGATTSHTYAGVDNTQRLTRDATTFTNAAVGLTGQSASGAATGFVREPSGTLVAMRTGGSSQYYLTDAQNSVLGLVDTPLHEHLSGPDGAVQDGRPLLRPAPRPLHPARPQWQGEQRVSLRHW